MPHRQEKRNLLSSTHEQQPHSSHVQYPVVPVAAALLALDLPLKHQSNQRISDERLLTVMEIGISHHEKLHFLMAWVSLGSSVRVLVTTSTTLGVDHFSDLTGW
jgi:hypothetical protein